jgi:energy-coupling factor transporter ATP-binding protein EcfA2
MKILKLRAENIKRLKAIEINTDNANFVEITGKNAQGKSSIMDSIAYALGGKKLIPERPIRDGEFEASIQVDVGDFIIDRRFVGEKSTIKVISKDGFTRNSPQSFLDDLIGTLSFDPLEFTQFDNKKRVEMFKKLAGVDTDELDCEYQEYYNLRTDAGKILKRAEASFDELKQYDKEIDVPNIKELQDLRDKSLASKTTIARLDDEKNRFLEKITALQLELDETHEQYKLVSKKLKVAESEEIHDIDDIDKQINDIQSLMLQQQKHNEYKTAKKHLDDARKDHEAHELKLNEIIKIKRKLIESAKLAVDGLTLRDNDLYYNDIPFEQLSQAEKLKVSMAMAIAESPKLKVVRIMDGSLLDSNSMQVLRDIATEHDFQVWIETVSNNKDERNAIYIEDGGIA